MSSTKKKLQIISHKHPKLVKDIFRHLRPILRSLEL